MNKKKSYDEKELTPEERIKKNLENYQKGFGKKVSPGFLTRD